LKPEASLLDLIRMKVFGHCTDKENPVSLPHEDLLAMTLRSMLTVIRALAKHRLVADDCTSPTGLLQIILAASRVLMDWPKNFIALLTDLGQKLPADVSGGVGSSLKASIKHCSGTLQLGHQRILTSSGLHSWTSL
jgi:hypothetical protein